MIIAPSKWYYDGTSYRLKNTTSIDLQAKKAVNMVFDGGATVPSSPTPVSGQPFYHTPTGRSVFLLRQSSAWVPVISTGTMTMYVSTNGTDAPDQGTATGTSAYATINYAISQIPFAYTNTVNIIISPGTYTENVRIQGKWPSASINVNFLGGNNAPTMESSGTAITGGEMGWWANSSLVAPQQTYITSSADISTWAGRIIKFTSSASGQVSIATLSAGGSGYAVGDIVGIDTGDGLAQVTVMTISGSAIATFRITASGSGYSTSGNPKSTTAATGSGTGATINVTSVGNNNTLVRVADYWDAGTSRLYLAGNPLLAVPTSADTVALYPTGGGTANDTKIVGTFTVAELQLNVQVYDLYITQAIANSSTFDLRGGGGCNVVRCVIENTSTGGSAVVSVNNGAAARSSIDTCSLIANMNTGSVYGLLAQNGCFHFLYRSRIFMGSTLDSVKTNTRAVGANRMSFVNIREGTVIRGNWHRAFESSEMAGISLTPSLQAIFIYGSSSGSITTVDAHTAGGLPPSGMNAGSFWLSATSPGSPIRRGWGGDGPLEFPSNNFHGGASVPGSFGLFQTVQARTFFDITTAASGTAAGACFNSYLAPVYSALNTGVTVTNAANVYINGAPSASTNVTFTNAYALWVDSGSCRFDGSVSIGSAAFPTAMLDVNGATSNQNCANVSATVTASTGARYGLFLNPTINVSSSGSGSAGLGMYPAFVPSVAAATLYAQRMQCSVANSSTAVASLVGVNSLLAASSYTGIVTGGYSNYSADPYQFALQGGVAQITTFYGYFQAAVTNGHANTSGSASNYGFYCAAATAAAASGGTIANYGARFDGGSGGGVGTTTNYGLYVTMGSGNTATTTNYGLYITGNGGASALANWALAFGGDSDREIAVLSHSSGAGKFLSLRGGDAFATSNVAGGSAIVRTGRGRGNAKPASILLQGDTVGASGSTQKSLVNRVIANGIIEGITEGTLQTMATIPIASRQAMAGQIQYMIEMGSANYVTATSGTLNYIATYNGTTSDIDIQSAGTTLQRPLYSLDGGTATVKVAGLGSFSIVRSGSNFLVRVQGDSEGTVANVSLVAGGTGYTNGTQTLTITNTYTNNATISVTVAGNIVTSVNSVSAAGSGYWLGGTVASGYTSFPTTGGGGTGCTVTVTGLGSVGIPTFWRCSYTITSLSQYAMTPY